MSDGDLRIGLVGTGAIAQIVHLPILKELPGARVEAVCDRDIDKARAIAGRMAVPEVFERDEDMLASESVDAVIICSPSHMHEDQAVAALEAGKHVLVERPLALDAKGVERVIHVAEKADRTLLVALNNRYRPDVQGVRAFVTGGELGDIFSVEGAWFNRKVRPKRLTWRHRHAEAGGGAFMDLGVQILDLCLWMLDYPEIDRVSAHLHRGENYDVEDAASVLLGVKDGGTISLNVTWSLLGEKDRHYVRIFGTAGSAMIQPLRVFKEVEHAVLDVTPQLPQGRENPYTAAYREELRQFVAAARGDSPVELPREQIRLMEIVSTIYESARKGKEIRL